MRPKARWPSVDDCCRWLRCSGWITGQGTGRYTVRLHFRTRTRLPKRPREARRSRLHFALKPSRQPHQDLRPVESPEFRQCLSYWMTFHAPLVVHWICLWWLSSSHLSIMLPPVNTRQLTDRGVGHNGIKKNNGTYTRSSTLIPMGVSERPRRGHEDQYPCLGSPSKGILELECHLASEGAALPLVQNEHSS